MIFLADYPLRDRPPPKNRGAWENFGAITKIAGRTPVSQFPAIADHHTLRDRPETSLSNELNVITH